MNRPPLPTATLAETAAWTRKQSLGGGAVCPCCGGRAQRYPRRLTVAMAKALVEFYRHRDRKGGFVHYRKALEDPTLWSDYGKLKYWGLLEQAENEDPKKAQNGFWRITFAGKEWLKARRMMPEGCTVYMDQAEGFFGEQITVARALRRPFDFSELMDPGETLEADPVPQLNLFQESAA